MNFFIKFFFQKSKTLLDIVLRYIFFPINFILFILIVLSKNLILIRVGKIKTAWLGEFVMRTEVYFHEKQLLHNNSIDFFIRDKFISNRFFWKKLKKKQIKILNFIFLDTLNLIYYFSRKFPSLKKNLAMREDQQKDFYKLLDHKKTYLDITKEEIKKGNEILNSNVNFKYKGIVLLCVRNNNYNETFFKGTNWNYLDYRNYSFDDFIPTAKYLADQNYLVLRMGKTNYKNYKFETHDNIIDYSNSTWRSDFMDYFLGYACSFVITTHTGMDCFARLFRKPFGAIVNPIEDIFFFQKNWTHIFGSFKNIENNKILDLNEIFKYGLHKINTLQNLNKDKFELIKNNKKEILDLTIEVDTKYKNDFLEIKTKNSNEFFFWEQFCYHKCNLINNLDPKYIDITKKISANIGKEFTNNLLKFSK